MKKLIFILIILFSISSCTVKRRDALTTLTEEKKTDKTKQEKTSNEEVLVETTYEEALLEGEDDTDVLFEKLTGIKEEDFNEETFETYTNSLGEEAVVGGFAGTMLGYFGTDDPKTVKFLSTLSLFFSFYFPCNIIYELISPIPGYEDELQLIAISKFFDMIGEGTDSQTITDAFKKAIYQCKNSEKGGMSLVLDQIEYEMKEPKTFISATLTEMDLDICSKITTFLGKERLLLEQLSDIPENLKYDKEIILSYFEEFKKLGEFSQTIGFYGIVTDILALHNIKSKKTAEFLSNLLIAFTPNTSCKDFYSKINPCPNTKNLEIIDEAISEFFLMITFDLKNINEDKPDLEERFKEKTRIKKGLYQCRTSEENISKLIDISL